MKLVSGRKMLAVLVAMLVVGGVVETTSAAAETLVWRTKPAGQKGEGTLLKKGESREVTFEGEAIKVTLDEAGDRFGVECKKSSGSGTVIGGEPGTGKVKSLSTSECNLWGLGGVDCVLAEAPRLENVETEPVELSSGKFAYKLKKIETYTQNSSKDFFRISNCTVVNGSYNISGNLEGTVPWYTFDLALPLGFPETKLEGTTLEWSGGTIEFKGQYTMKLANGEELAVY